MIDIEGVIMDMKIATKLGVRPNILDKLLPLLVRYAIIDKSITPITFFKLRRAIEKEAEIKIDEAEWELFKKIRYLYSLVMDLSEEELILLGKIIEILLRGEK